MVGSMTGGLQFRERAAGLRGGLADRPEKFLHRNMRRTGTGDQDAGRPQECDGVTRQPSIRHDGWLAFRFPPRQRRRIQNDQVKRLRDCRGRLKPIECIRFHALMKTAADGWIVTVQGKVQVGGV